jgi:tight adherence protein C
MTLERLMHDPNAMAALSGFGAFAVVVLIWLALIESGPLPERLKSVTQRRSELRQVDRKKKVSRLGIADQTNLMKRVVEKLKMAQGQKLDALRLKLARAGYRSRDTMFAFLFAKLAMPPVMAFLCFFFIFVLHAAKVKPAMGFMLVIAFGLFGIVVPDIFIKNQTQKRADVLRKAMPDALDLMVICAEAGLGLDATFERVSREIGPSCSELAEEIGLTAVELSFLPDRSKALQNLADRIPLPGVLALANTLIQTEKYGTPLAQSLRVLSGEMREERIMAAEAKAAKLPATLTVPMILFILPPLFVVLIGPAILKVMGLSHGH